MKNVLSLKNQLLLIQRGFSSDIEESIANQLGGNGNDKMNEDDIHEVIQNMLNRKELYAT